MINSRPAAKTANVSDDRREAIRSLYMESLQLVERLHRRLLDVIKDEFEHNFGHGQGRRRPRCLTGEALWHQQKV